MNMRRPGALKIHPPTWMVRAAAQAWETQGIVGSANGAKVWKPIWREYASVHAIFFTSPSMGEI